MAFNPLIWKGFDLQDKAHEQLFMSQLSDLLNALNSAQGLANLINGKGVLGSSALNYISPSFTLTTNQTINLSNVAKASIFLQVTTAFSPVVTLTNVALGTDIQISFANGSASPVNLKIAASDPSGVSYTVFGFATGALTNLVSTGIAVAASGHQLLLKGTTLATSLEFMYVAT